MGLHKLYRAEIAPKIELEIFTVCAIIFGQFTLAFHFFKLHKESRSLHL